MKITNIRHAWPERAGFRMNRPNGAEEYIFLHFWSPVIIIYKGEEIVTKPHACIIYNIGTPQYFGWDKDSAHDWFHVTGDVPKFLEKFRIPLDTIFYPQNFNFITDIVREIEMEINGRPEFYEIICEAKMNELFAKLSREHRNSVSEISINPKTIELLQNLRHRLCYDSDQNWTIERMADYIGLSPSYLHATYKQFYKVSPIKDLIAIRMERAKSILFRTELTISEIARQLGYANTSHFIRQFTQNEGISPAKYRETVTVPDRFVRNNTNRMTK